MSSFAETFLIEVLGSRLLLEPGQSSEVRRGLECAMGAGEGEGVGLEKLLEVIEKVGLPEQTGVINLLSMPLGPLWVRAALREQKKHLSGHTHPRLIVVGLWKILSPNGKRTPQVEARFGQWRDFIESQLLSVNNHLTVVWIG